MQQEVHPMTDAKAVLRESSSPKVDRHKPLRPYLMGLTLVTGIVDAVSYLLLGHVFVANMTGNVVFLGFAITAPRNFSIPATLAATLAFLAGAFVGGRVGALLGRHRARLLTVSIYVEVVLVAAALVASIYVSHPAAAGGRYLLIVLLASAMGLQNAAARRLGVPDLTTTVLTLTLTGLAADASLAGGARFHLGVRLAATVVMFLGAALGAFLITRYGMAAALAASVIVLVLSGASTSRLWSSVEEWTVGA
jgi:uncharacterized membrane protein YoaK (UPF0700 family)